MNWETVGSIFGIVATVGLLIVGGLLILVYGVVQTQKSTIEARGQRVDDLEKEVARLTAQVAQTAAENQVLRSVTTGEVHWRAIGEQLEHHHEEAQRHWGRDEELLEEIRDVIRRRQT